MSLVVLAARNRIRIVLASSILILSVIIVSMMAYNSTIIYLPQWRQADAVVVGNQMADHLMRAAGQEAVERGITNTALNQRLAGRTPPEALVHNIRERRSNGDAALAEALTLADKLAERGWGGTEFRARLEDTRERHEALTRARSAADGVIGGTSGAITPEEWVQTITATIEATARLRTTAFKPAAIAPDDQFLASLYNNLQVKQALWLASEYAGRERAQLGGLIGGRQPMPPETRELLSRFRGIVDLQMVYIGEAMALLSQGEHRNGAVAGIRNAHAQMQAKFLGEFQRTREQIYTAAETGEYPIDGAEWIRRSTEAIDTILALSEAVSVDAGEAALAARGQSHNMLIISILLIVGALVVILANILLSSRLLFRPLKQLHDRLQNIASADADLSQRVEIRSKDEIGEIAGAFNHIMENFRVMVSSVVGATRELRASTEHLRTLSERSAGGVQRQRSEVEQVATAMNEMAATVQEVARNAQGAADAADSARGEAEAGKQVVAATMTAIDALAADVGRAAQVIQALDSRSSEIGGILDVIRGVAEQTNLLALNAAIEAARAGEQGRGFAVVADEVRTLASRTQRSTHEIQQMIEKLQSGAAEAVSVMEAGTRRARESVEQASRAQMSLEGITYAVTTINDMNAQIASAAEEQLAVAEEINRNITNISHVSEESADGARETSSSSEQLARLSDELYQLVARFKV